MKITERDQVFGTFFPQKNKCIRFDRKNGLGYSLGDFFTNSSGHPADRFSQKMTIILGNKKLSELHTYMPS
jgi:hypothetical protein